MRNAGGLIVSSVCAIFAVAAAAPPASADALLSGTVTAADGKPMGGVTVSAKPDGGTITTTVFTDEAGGYYFRSCRGITACGRRRSASRPPRARRAQRAASQDSR